MKLQEIFDTVTNHLLEQNCKSVAETGQCSYRTPTGLKCAAGCLISDSEYKPDMEGNTILSLFVKGMIPIHLEPHISELACLQRIHDTYEPLYWPYKLLEFAKLHNLTVPYKLKIK